MNFNDLHFAKPNYFWALILLPILFFCYNFYRRKKLANIELSKFADPELLPHLVIKEGTNRYSGSFFTIFALLFASVILALASPRWKFSEYQGYKPSSALVILIDLAEKMQAEDVKPNRVARAKQQINDLLKFATGMRVGLIGFANFPHIISPITDDFATILHLLPAIDVDLISKQGCDLDKALLTANNLLAAEPGNNKNILLLSNGEFKQDFTSTINKMVANNIKVFVIGVGKQEGAPYKDNAGRWHKEQGKLVLSKLADNMLANIAKQGNGSYWHASFSDADNANIIKQITKDNFASNIIENVKIRQWQESFFYLLIPALILALILKTRLLSLSFVVLIICFSYSSNSYAKDFLLNNEQRAEKYFNDGNYEQSAAKFNDPYRKGVALYKAGKFKAAEQEFKTAKRASILVAAKYNLANCYLKQGNYQAAINEYEEVLKKDPNHQYAKDNLTIAQQLLANQPARPKCDKNCNNNDDKNNTKDNNEQDSKQQNNQATTKQEDTEKEQPNDSNKKQQNTLEESQITQDDNKNFNKQKNVEQNNDKKQQSAQTIEEEQKPADKEANKSLINTEQDNNSKQTNEDFNKNGDLLTPENQNYSNKKESNKRSLTDNFEKSKAAETDLAAELLLKRIDSNIKVFLKNKFAIEENK